jgi:peroxiredoxin Q/BCP
MHQGGDRLHPAPERLYGIRNRGGGISADPLGAQERFRDKHGLEIPLISDEKHQMLEAYGAWGEKSMYGRTFLGIIRTTVLIDTEGRVARVWRHVKVDGHADDVLASARAL